MFLLIFWYNCSQVCLYSQFKARTIQPKDRIKLSTYAYLQFGPRSACTLADSIWELLSPQHSQISIFIITYSCLLSKFVFRYDKIRNNKPTYVSKLNCRGIHDFVKANSYVFYNFYYKV